MMIVSLRKWRKVVYSLFTMYMPAVDTINRPGGYVAVTVSVSGIIPVNRFWLYRILEEALKSMAEEKVFEGNKILIESFDTKTDFFQNLSYSVVSKVNDSSDLSLPIVDFQQATNGADVTGYNLEDVERKDFLNDLYNNGTAYVSNIFCSMKENNEYKLKYEEEKKKHDELEKKLNAMQNNQPRSNSEELKTLRGENERLKEENTELRQRSDEVSGKVDDLRSSVNKSGKMVKKAADKVMHDNRPWVRLSVLFPIINTILLFILLYLVIGNIDGLKKNSNDHSTTVKDSINSADMVDKSNSRGDNSPKSDSEPPLNTEIGYHAHVYEEGGESTATVLNGKNNAIKEQEKEKVSLKKTADVILEVSNQEGKKIINGTSVKRGEVLTVNCKDGKSSGYQFYAENGCTVTQQGILVSNDENVKQVKFYFCDPADRDVPFKSQPNKREFSIQ